MASKRVVITGLGAVTPIGNNISEFWDGISSGKSGAGAITKFDASLFKTQFACEVKDFDPKEYLDTKEVRRLDPFSQYALVATQEAISDSKLLEFEDLDRNEVGVIWSSGIGGQLTFQSEVSKFAVSRNENPEASPRYSPMFIPKMILDIAAGHISIKYGFKGPNYAVVSACASSTNGLIDAFNCIKLGYADVMISGGSEASITECAMGGFNALKALSTRNDSPETASRPFDAERDGFVMGEGAGALVLESLEHAQARGAKIYAELVGIGMSADAHHITAPHPEGEGATLVMNRALKNASISAEDIDYVNVHGTSTPLGDIAEIKAIEKVFKDHAYQLNISSSKSMTGHLLGAAGAVESIACILAIQHQTVPPTINHENFDEDIDQRLNLTLNKAEKRTINYALSNTFGFGGHNASVIFKKFEG